MKNYNTLARTNFFVVNNSWDLEQWADFNSFKVVEHNDKGKTTYALWLGNNLNNLTNVAKELAQYLADDNVAVLIEISYKEFEHVTCKSIAVNNNGETKTIDINDIYKLAEELGTVTKETVTSSTQKNYW